VTDRVETAAAFVIDNWDALGIEEHEGVLHMPATIKRRNKAGGHTDVPVMLRNVTNHHRFRARLQSRELASKLKLDLERDADYLSDLENYALLAYAVRDPKTYDQHVPDAETLLNLYDNQSLVDLWGRYNVWVEMLDPRFGQMDADQLWQVIVRIAREKTPAPLVSMPGHAQYTCMVLMAREALLSPNRPSWLQSSETSTPAA
jgi:hypothetical protein